MGLVSAASRLASSPVPPWLEWAGRLAYLSFAVIVADGFRLAALVPQLGQLYHGCGSCTGTLAEQQTLARWLFTTLPLDAQNWIAFGALGVWVLALCAAGLQSGRLPRPLAYLGIALTLAFWLLVAGTVSAQPALFIVGAVAGGIVLGPLFFAWLGVQLRRSGESV